MKITYLKDFKLSNIRIYVCTPATGKSYLEKNYDCFVDMDALKAKYKYGIGDSEMELYKGNRDKLIARAGAEKYISQKIDEFLANTDKILLFASNPKLLKL